METGQGKRRATLSEFNVRSSATVDEVVSVPARAVTDLSISRGADLDRWQDAIVRDYTHEVQSYKIILCVDVNCLCKKMHKYTHISPLNGLSQPPNTSCLDADSVDERNRRLISLIASAATGNCAAFEEIYNATVSALLLRVRRIVGEAYAEDVLSEVYLQVWRSLQSYDASRGNAMAWLFAIARTRALDRVRAERRRHAGQLESGEFDPDEFASAAHGPEEYVAQQQAARYLRACMGRLSAKERMVLGLAYFQDCTQAQIASLTRLPLGSVKSLMTRSQQKLRAALIESPPAPAAFIAPASAGSSSQFCAP